MCTIIERDVPKMLNAKFILLRDLSKNKVNLRLQVETSRICSECVTIEKLYLHQSEG